MITTGDEIVAAFKAVIAPARVGYVAAKPDPLLVVTWAFAAVMPQKNKIPIRNLREKMRPKKGIKLDDSIAGPTTLLGLSLHLIQIEFINYVL